MASTIRHSDDVHRETRHKAGREAVPDPSLTGESEVIEAVDDYFRVQESKADWLAEETVRGRIEADRRRSELRRREADPLCRPRDLDMAQKRYEAAEDALGRTLDRAEALSETDRADYKRLAKERWAARIGPGPSAAGDSQVSTDEPRASAVEARPDVSSGPTALPANELLGEKPPYELRVLGARAIHGFFTGTGRWLLVLFAILLAFYFGLWFYPRTQPTSVQPAATSSEPPGAGASAAASAPPSAPAPPASAKPASAAAPSVAASASNPASWFITKAVPITHNLGTDSPYDTADLTVPDFDPGAYRWIAISERNNLADLPLGANGADGPNGVLKLIPCNTDDYILVSITGPRGSADAIRLQDNIAEGGWVGNQAVIAGTFGMVRTIPRIDYLANPPVSYTSVQAETGSLTGWFAGQGRGQYTFHLEFWNAFTGDGSHSDAWLLAGT